MCTVEGAGVVQKVVAEEAEPEKGAAGVGQAREEVVLDTSTQDLVGLEGFTLHDIEAVRLILRGGSVVDWRKASFESPEEVRRFIRSNGLDPNNPRDLVRLHTLHREAVIYLKENLAFTFPEHLARPVSLIDVFMTASRRSGREQQLACALLKVMHILNHIEARELRHRISIPDRELFSRVEQRVKGAVAGMGAAGIKIHQFIPSVKKKSSVVTKLLSKRRNLAAEIYDRIRFRIVTDRYEDLLPALRYLVTNLFPFNYVTPEESRNDVLDFRGILETTVLRRYIDRLQFPLQNEDRSHIGLSFNEFSARNYRTISFVVDIPLRLDTFMPPEGKLFEEFGPLVYITSEFQMVDRETAINNEKGEGSHREYKRRQLNRVQYRLTHGAKKPVPGLPPTFGRR